MSVEYQVQKNRNYKGKFVEDYIVYEYTQTRTLKDGTVKQYKNIVRQKRNPKNKGVRGKDKQKRQKKKVPRRLTRDIYKLTTKMTTDNQALLMKHIQEMTT